MPNDTDFIGFSFGGIHSSTLNIQRTISSNRINDNLTPTASDVVNNVPGVDKTYYFSTSYSNRTFNIDFCYDSLTEPQLRDLARLFDPKGAIRPLIFDELPYKVYRAKVQSAPVLTYVPFEINGQRIYRGEGKLVLICYDPLAQTPVGQKFLAQYPDASYPNKSQQAATSGMKAAQGTYDIWQNGTSGVFAPVYNAGDKNAPFRITMSAAKFRALNTGLQLYDHTPATPQLISFLYFSGTNTAPNNITYTIDTEKHLILGSDGLIYNRYISSGDQFDIPTMLSTQDYRLYLNGATLAEGETPITLEYNYLYY